MLIFLDYKSKKKYTESFEYTYESKMMRIMKVIKKVMKKQIFLNLFNFYKKRDIM